MMLRSIKQKANAFNMMSKSFNSGHGVLRGMSTKVDSFLSGSAGVYAEQMYEAWKKDPAR